MIIYVTTKSIARDYDLDDLTVLGAFFTLKQAKGAAQADTAAGDDLRWVGAERYYEAESFVFGPSYTVTQHEVSDE